MRDKSHRTIFILISSCALAILLLQGFWIRNFYLQVKAQFEGNVYAGLDHVVRKLQERKHLRTIQERHEDFSVNSGKPGAKKQVFYSDSVLVINAADSPAQLAVRKTVRVPAQ